MVKFSIEDIEKVMKVPKNIRNISVVAHVDHGKTTLSDSLVCRAGIIPERAQGDACYMSVRKDEIIRGITIKSSSVSLHFEHGNEQHLINLIDSPGHVDFSSEVTAALRVTDGALVVVDAVEGVCVQTETVLRQALTERIVPILFVNKADRLFLELKCTLEDTYLAFRRAIESANVVVASFQVPDPDNGYAVIDLDPRIGNVGFGSGYQGWGFTLAQFARLYEAKLGVPAEKLVGKLWGDHFYDPSTRRWTTSSEGADGKTLRRGFCQYILEPIQFIIDYVMEGRLDKLAIVLESVGVSISQTELESVAGKDLLKLVMRRFLPADDCILGMVVTHLPSPVTAQRYRYQHLYKGPLDDEAAIAMRDCNPDGPLMMFVSKMIPSDGGRFYAFGRVFSGTVSPGQKVRILAANTEDNKAVTRAIQGTVLMMGRKVESIPSCPCGNIIGLTGVDQYLIKSGTITTGANASPIAPMVFSVSPVVRVSVDVENAVDLPKLVESLKRLAKTDPAIQVYTEQTGEHILAAVGELQLEICLNDLREFCQCNIVTSNPVVSYRETVTEKSQVCLSKSPNKHNRIYMTAEPVGDDLVEALEKKKITPTMDIQQRIQDMGLLGWNATDVRNIWSFSSPNSVQNDDGGSNLLVNGTTGIQYLNESRDHIISAFQWVSNQGVLCEEPLRGVKFCLADIVTISDAIHRGGGQITPTSRRVMMASQMTAQPRLVEPIYMADIQVSESAVGGVYSAIGRRRGIVVEESQTSRGIFSVRAYLPVSESFGFAAFLSTETSGRAFLQMTFDHWESVPTNPLELTSKSNEIVQSIRTRKGLKPNIPPLQDYLDRL